MPTWTISDSRARRCKRWSLYPEDVIDLSVAEMDLPVAEPIMEVLRDAVERQAFGYPLPAEETELPRAAATWLAAKGLTVEPEQIRLMPDVIKGIVLSLRHHTEAGTPVAMITPTYSRFHDAAVAAEREVIEVPMLDPGDGYVLDLEGVDAALGAGARSVLLCNPSNPVGRVFSRQELSALADLVESHGARTISDEIHAPLAYDGGFTPYASVGEHAAAHSMTHTSASKGWNIPGLRCALVVMTSPDDPPVWDSLPRASKGGISPLGIEATVAAFTRGGAWMDQALANLAQSRETLLEALGRSGLGDLVHRPEATYLAWLDLRRFGLADARTHLLEHAGVAVTAGEEHGGAGTGFVRLNFATPPDVLTTAVDRIAGALGT